VSASWIEKYVDAGDFTGLFIEGLGWSKPRQQQADIKLDNDGETLAVSEVAHYKGIAVWACPVIPAGNVQRAVDNQLRKYSTERIVIFHDDDHQVWRWPQSRDASGAGSPRLVTHDHVVGRGNEALRQRLQLIKIGLDEDPSVVEATRRLRKAFDSDKVTKKFYRKFADEHAALIAVIEGIEVSDPVTKPELRWYGSLLLNRLMFIYFMQRKGFLDNDPDYLRNRLQQIQSLGRPQSFYVFYRDFLLPLFHEGLGASEGHRNIKDPVIRELLGDVPYVNGGIFSRHVIEETNDIRVPDDAFERLFSFFDSWQWHLDDRPSGNPNEINPDVLGYIFEQFVNHREEVGKSGKSATTNSDKGAYYTKEDVTGYMVANTLVPVFLERLESSTGVNPWKVLQKYPDRYIWSSLRHGLSENLPSDIVGEADAANRPAWDSTLPSESLALAGETWWEVVDRRQHVEALRGRIQKGKLNSYSAAISENLDLEALAIDVVDGLDNPSDVAAAWSILSDLRVIDPTCGSGAFLFAALNVLHRLYEAVLESAETHASTAKHKGVRSILDAAGRHPNRDYFILKHATISNLYGVDIMAEAVEIARLRLFLKLVSQVEHRSEVEPLPDLEFNILTGNILVGALTVDDVRDKADLLVADEIEALSGVASGVSADYREFARAQVAGDDEEFRKAKARLVATVADVRERLNDWWHRADNPELTRSEYLNRTVPFHWFIEFPSAFEAGGFDAVIGNPPYVAGSKVPYSYSGFATDACPDIYAACLERASAITAAGGRLSMIVPISSQFADDFIPLRKAMRSRFEAIWVSTFDRRPDSLFGAYVGVRNSIWTCANDASSEINVTKTNRWPLEYRPFLFESLRYFRSSESLTAAGWSRASSPGLVRLLTEVRSKGTGSLATSTSPTGTHNLYFKGNALYYLSVFIDPPPVIEPDGTPGTPTMMGKLRFHTKDERDAALAVLLSKVAFVWWGLTSDNLNVTVSGLASTPFDLAAVSSTGREELSRLGRLLARELPKHLSTTVYRQRTVSRYVIPELRPITDQVDRLLASELSYVRYLPDIQLAYSTLFKGADDES
jgi:hypothetical protein